eukprot:ANDGO_03284.mRNA.1 hypothetical protein H257_12452
MAETRIRALQEEFSELQRQHDETKRLFLESCILVDHLREASRKKDARIAKLEADLARMYDEHQMELQVVQEEKNTEESHIHHNLRKLQLEIERLQDENSVLQGYEEENGVLRNMVDEMQRKVAVMEEENAKGKSLMQQEVSRIRTVLESEYKSMLKEFEKQSRANAEKTVYQESVTAADRSQQLSQALTKQNENLEDLLKRFVRIEQDYDRLKTERDLDQGQSEMHAQMYVQLKSKLNASEQRVADLEQSLQSTRVERSSVELLFAEREALIAERESLKARLDKSKDRARKWRSMYEECIKNSGPTTPSSPLKDKRSASSHSEVRESVDDDNVSFILPKPSKNDVLRARYEKKMQQEMQEKSSVLRSIWNSSMIHVPSVEVPAQQEDSGHLLRSTSPPSQSEGEKTRMYEQQSIPVSLAAKQLDSELSVLSKHSGKRQRVLENREKLSASSAQRFGLSGVSLQK